MEEVEQVVEASEEKAAQEHSPDPGVEEQIEMLAAAVPEQVEADGELESSESDIEQVISAEGVVEPPPTLDSVTLPKSIIEAAIYVTDEPLSAEQIAAAIELPLDQVNEILQQLVAEYATPEHGLSIRELAGGYKMSTKPEHHEAIRRFVRKLQPPLKLSLAALETLAVVAYKQPITGPEILDIRGVQGAGVLKTLLDRKLIATAGRKNVLGKPIMYKTTREFLIQFGLNSLAELPTLKEFEELGRLALTDEEEVPAAGGDAREVEQSEHEQLAFDSAETESEAAAAEDGETGMEAKVEHNG